MRSNKRTRRNKSEETLIIVRDGRYNNTFALHETNIEPENQWLEDTISVWDGLFSGAILVVRRLSCLTSSENTHRPCQPKQTKGLKLYLPDQFLCLWCPFRYPITFALFFDELIDLMT